MPKLHKPNPKKFLKKQENVTHSNPKLKHDEIKNKKPKLNFLNIFRRKKEENIQDQNLKKIEDEITTKKPKLNFFGFFKKKKTEEGKGIEYFKKQIKKKKKRRATVLERRHRLRYYIDRAGFAIGPESLSKKLFNISVIINLIISAFLIYHFSTTLGITWTTILLSIVALWILVFVVLLFILWVLFYILVDLKIFKRKVDIEDVLPDYLQLTASNIKSGMTIDRALWYAVRPRFGVLAKEIEIVAKETMRGEDLKTALQKFADKYDSVLLKRSINLIIEGLLCVTFSCFFRNFLGLGLCSLGIFKSRLQVLRILSWKETYTE